MPIETRSPEAAARAYRSVLGWPLLVGCRYRPRQGCTCGAADCPAPGAHPPPGPLWVPVEDEFRGQVRSAPGASLITPTIMFDALVMSRQAGTALLIALETVAPLPCMLTETHATVLVLPSTGRYAVSRSVPVEVRSGPAGWVALPPTRGVHWDTPPWLEGTQRPVPLLHGRDVAWYLAAAHSQAVRGA